MVHSVRTTRVVGGTKRNDMILHYLIRSWKIEEVVRRSRRNGHKRSPSSAWTVSVCVSV